VVSVPALRILVRRNLRKRPGQVVAMVLLTLLAAVPMNLGFMMAVRYPALVEERLDAVSAEDAVVMVSDAAATTGSGTTGTATTGSVTSDSATAGPASAGSGSSAAASDVRTATQAFADAVAADPSFSIVERQAVLTGMVAHDFGGADATSAVALLDLDDPPGLGAWSVVETLPTPVEDPVYAPYIYRTGGGYALGDPITFTSPHGSLTFHIQGFLEEPTMGMTTMGMVGFAVPGSAFADLQSSQQVLTPAELVKVRGADDVDAVRALTTAVGQWNSEHPDAQVESLWDMGRTLISQGALTGARIFAAALVLFALIIIGVAAAAARFLVGNAINSDMRNLGVMSALGFTSSQVVRQLWVVFTTCAVLGASAGVVLSHLVAPVLATALSDQTGLMWRPGFDAWALVTTVGLLALVVTLTAVAAGSRIRRMSTLTALRGGAATHVFTRDPLPLSTTRGPTNLVLGVKTGLQHLPQAVMVTATMVVVAMMSVLGLSLSTNVLGNPDQFTRMLVGDLPDATVQATDSDAAERLVAEISALPGVEQAFRAELTGLEVNGIATSVFIADDFSAVSDDSVYAGRLPQHANEVALGSTMATELDTAMGQEVTLDLNGGSATYLVTGITSTARGLGRSVDLTTDGMRAALPGYPARVVSLKVQDHSGIDALLTRISQDHPDQVASTANQYASVSTQVSGYHSMVSALSVIIVVSMGLVVTLVVGLVVATMVVQSRRRVGILKAIGYTTGDLTTQMLAVHVPWVALGALVGGGLGLVAQDPILSWALSTTGLMRSDFPLDVAHPLWVALSAVALAAAVTWVASRGLGRVSARALVTEE